MVKHSTVVTGTNNAAYQISVNAWNAEHDTPVGVVWLWAGAIANIPVNWLLCDGSSLSRTTYAVLFNAIGTIYGYVDGSHFNLPDLRDKFVVGAKQDVSGVPETNLTGSLTAYGGAVTHHHADTQRHAACRKCAYCYSASNKRPQCYSASRCSAYLHYGCCKNQYSFNISRNHCSYRA